MSRILMFAGLTLGACVAGSSRCERATPDSYPGLTPKSGVARAGELQLLPDSPSSVELQGTATIGAWNCRSTHIGGQVILETDEAALDALFDRINKDSATDHSPQAAPELSLPPRDGGAGASGAARAEIIVPITSLRCDSSGMEHDLRAALKSDQHPMIEYTFQKALHASVQTAPNHQPEIKLSILGSLQMAGVSRPITMNVKIKRDSSRRFQAHAETQLDMTDFGVVPPQALLGLIKAGNQVHVIFNLSLVLRHDVEKP